ncbi:MAG: hypothetical protein HZB79_09795, partial [Deltaproteobacteria bacterium]|nr:hypothetical protein [Deltaproteobacteria bacterium]
NPLLLFICLSVIIMASPATAGARPLSIIYAGEGIGNIRLGHRMEDVIKNLGWGKPEEFRKYDKNGEYYLIYKAKGVSFIFQAGKKAIGENILQKVIINSPAFITAGKGIRVGDNGVDVKEPIPSQQQKGLTMQSSMGGCTDKDGDADKKEIVCKGIKFIVNKETDIIEAIEVFYPK